MIRFIIGLLLVAAGVYFGALLWSVHSSPHWDSNLFLDNTTN